MIGAVHFIVPGTAVPLVVAGEIKNSRTLQVERNVVVDGQLIRKHLRANADTLIGPALPHAVGVQPHGNRGLGESSRDREKSKGDPHR